MDETQAQLDAHERECAIRYQSVQDKLDALDKRMWRLEAMIMGSTVIIVGLAASLLMKFRLKEKLMLAELAAANAAFAIIKKTIANGQDLVRAGKAISTFVNAEENLKKRGDSKKNSFGETLANKLMYQTSKSLWP